ncbi:MAG: hypothetical protein ACYDA8_15000 [Deferrisomatales bacterium]
MTQGVGLLHALLTVGGEEALLSHPVMGASWEGFVLEALLPLDLADLAPDRRFVVYSGQEAYPVGPETHAVSLPELARRLAHAAP